jgi:hypothetical protein
VNYQKLKNLSPNLKKRNLDENVAVLIEEEVDQDKEDQEIDKEDLDLEIDVIIEEEAEVGKIDREEVKEEIMHKTIDKIDEFLTQEEIIIEEGKIIFNYFFKSIFKLIQQI